MCNADNLYHHLLSQSVKIKKQIEDITRWGEDMSFIFEWQNNNNILRTRAASEYNIVFATRK